LACFSLRLRCIDCKLHLLPNRNVYHLRRFWLAAWCEPGIFVLLGEFMSRRIRPSFSLSQPPVGRTLLAATLASLACSALAEEALNLGQTVVTASGFEQNLRDAPAAITVISAEELKK